MDYTKLTKDFLLKEIESKKNIIDGNLFTIKNNDLINIRICYKICNNNDIIDIYIYSYIVNNLKCRLCNYYEEYRYINPTICNCNKSIINLNTFFNNNIEKENITYNNNIEEIQQILYDLVNKSLEFINLVKKCNNCLDYIYTTKNICTNCYWQNAYNEKYGDLLDDECCICFNSIYITDAVSICGNPLHSIHNKCNRDLKSCPLCRGTNTTNNNPTNNNSTNNNPTIISEYDNIDEDEDDDDF